VTPRTRARDQARARGRPQRPLPHHPPRAGAEHDSGPMAAPRPQRERAGQRAVRLLPCRGELVVSRLTPRDRHTSPNQSYGTPRRGLAAMSLLRAMCVPVEVRLETPVRRPLRASRLCPPTRSLARRSTRSMGNRSNRRSGRTRAPACSPGRSKRRGAGGIGCTATKSASWRGWPIAVAGSRRAGQPRPLGTDRSARAGHGIARRQGS
jgi:hypothetical protein